MSTTIIIPTCNAAEHLPYLLEKLKSQTIGRCELIIVDSASEDETVEIALSHQVAVISIARSEFDHGATRSLGARQAKGDTLVYLTQDALPYNQYAIENIIKPLKCDRSVGAAFGRQLASPGASVLAEHLRLFNYPDTSRLTTLDDRDTCGIKTAFLSNSFAAYRKSVLEEIGYFKSGLVFGEDTHAGARILLKGYKIAYVAEAMALHSHNYTIGQDFRRYFNMGAFHKAENWLLKEFGKPEGQAFKYIMSGIRFLSKRRKLNLFPEFMLRIIAKYVGYKLGKLKEQKGPFFR